MWETTKTKKWKRNKNRWFRKDKSAIDMKQKVSIKINLERLYGEPNSNIPSARLWKSKSRLKSRLLGHYQDKILILSTKKYSRTSLIINRGNSNN